MTRSKVLEELKQYKHYEGKAFTHNGKNLTIAKVIAAPKDSHILAKHYKDYLTHDEAMIKSKHKMLFDIYFFKKGFPEIESVIRLKDLKENYQEV
jgi:hypothetical protein